MTPRPACNRQPPPPLLPHLLQTAGTWPCPQRGEVVCGDQGSDEDSQWRKVTSCCMLPIDQRRSTDPICVTGLWGAGGSSRAVPHHREAGTPPTVCYHHPEYSLKPALSDSQGGYSTGTAATRVSEPPPPAPHPGHATLVFCETCPRKERMKTRQRVGIKRPACPPLTRS